MKAMLVALTILTAPPRPDVPLVIRLMSAENSAHLVHAVGASVRNGLSLESTNDPLR